MENKTAPGSQFKVTNSDLQHLARYHERKAGNNNVFNGKNLSDNTKVSNYYTLKAEPVYQSPLLYFGNQGPNTVGEEKPRQVPESSMVKELFTNNVAVALHGWEDREAKPEPEKKVSNLVSAPKMNEKYDDAWFLKHNPQHWNNLRTLGLIKDLTKDEEDPIMKLNPTLYKVVNAKVQEDSNFTDPFQKIMQ